MIDSLIDFRGFSPRRFFAALSAACSRTNAFDSGTSALLVVTSSVSSSSRSWSFSHASAVVAHCLTRISSAGVEAGSPAEFLGEGIDELDEAGFSCCPLVEAKLTVALAGGK